MKLRESCFVACGFIGRVLRVLLVCGAFYHYFTGQMLHAIFWAVIALFLLMRQK